MGDGAVSRVDVSLGIPENIYDALIRLASAHRREVCECENCPPGRAFQYDNCRCGEDWHTCSDDVATLEAWFGGPIIG